MLLLISGVLGIVVNGMHIWFGLARKERTQLWYGIGCLFVCTFLVFVLLFERW